MKLSKDASFEDYIGAVAHYRRTHPEVRLGQAYYNALFFMDPELAREVVMTMPEIDPYYNDSNLDAFLAYLQQHWTQDDQ